jgi:hypothetical protein
MLIIGIKGGVMKFNIAVSVVCILITFATTVSSAEKPFNVVEQKMWTFSKIIWELGIKFNKKENVATSDQLATALKDKDIPHKDKIAEFLSKGQFFGGSTILYLISNSSFPIGIYNYSEQKALGINCIASSTVFNTLKLNEYQRGSKMITQIIFPYIKELHETLKDSTFEYFIIGLFKKGY